VRYGAFDPPPQLFVAGDAGGFDVDHRSHRLAGEVHRPCVGLVEGGVGAFLAETEHEFCADDAGRHVPVDEEAEAAEHLALRHVRRRAEHGADAVGEILVVGHAPMSLARRAD
jgi:hypothetical protein